MTEQGTVDVEQDVAVETQQPIGLIDDATPMGRVFVMQFPDAKDTMTLIGRDGDTLTFQYGDGGQHEVTVNGWNEEGNADGNASMVIGYADPDGTKVGYDPNTEDVQTEADEDDDEDADDEPAAAETPAAPTPKPTALTKEIPAEMLANLKAAREDLALASHDHHIASEDAKAKKKRVEVAQARYNAAGDAIVNHLSPLPLPLVKEIEKAKAESTDTVATATSTNEKGTTDSLHAVDDDAWRTVRLDSLSSPAIGSRTLKALSEHEPPILTMGDFSAWQEKKKDFWATDIKDIGEKGKNEIEEATMAFWERRDKEKSAKPTSTFPTPASLIEGDGQCDGSCGWEDFAKELEALLEDDAFEKAHEFFSEVLYWVEENQHCTRKQKQAVENIKNAWHV